jgi:single-strand DNA-binding protein
LIGHLENQPEIKHLDGGASQAKLALRVIRFERSGEAQRSDLIDIIAWNNLAQNVTTLQMGQMLLIEGRISVNTYQDGQGETIWKTEVVASKIKNLNEKSQHTPVAVLKKSSEASIKSETTGTEIPETIEDEVPF